MIVEDPFISAISGPIKAQDAPRRRYGNCGACEKGGDAKADSEVVVAFAVQNN